MKRVIIIGCTGSGKSTFAKKLHKITNIPLYHLDMLYWTKEGTRITREKFIKKLEPITNLDCYIIDGDYIHTLEMRLAKCDTVIFLDYDASVCLAGVRTRTGKKRSDVPFVETEEQHTEGFYNHIKNYNVEERPVVLELLNKYSSKDIHIFKSRLQANNYLNELENKFNAKKLVDEYNKVSECKITNYNYFSFGDDTLLKLVLSGKKTITSSLKKIYDLVNEDLPKVNDYSVILDNNNQACCIIKNKKVSTIKYLDITSDIAYLEGEGDKSLDYWKKVHQEFFTKELEPFSLAFDEKMDLIVEEFEVIFKIKS